MTSPSQDRSSADIITNQVKIVGRYELLDPIGHGGMAIVYLARQTDLDRQVALKELRMFQSPDDPALAERFLREARMAGSMSHPNIVTVHEYFKHEDTPYIAMEYLQRGSLRPWVGSLTVAQIAGVLEGLLAALDHAERFRIVHRDLKPENLLVTDQGQIKVADFGIAKARTMNTNAFLTAANTTVGTPSYMAPEQAMAQDLGPHTDLYSVGVIAYELLVGRVPFHDTDTPVAIILRHVNEQIPLAHTVNPTIDRALSNWIDRLLIKDPAQRTQTAEQAWDELEEVVLRLLGSRWRREARLLASSEQPAVQPLTPAPFMSTGVETPAPETPVAETPVAETPVAETPVAETPVAETPVAETPADALPAGSPSGDFQSFAWGAAQPPAPQVAPAADLGVPGPAGPRVGDPEPEVDAAPAFLTFAKPAPDPGEPAHDPGEPAHEAAHEPGEPAREPAQPAAHAPPAAPAEPSAPTGPSGFETFAPRGPQPDQRDVAPASADRGASSQPSGPPAAVELPSWATASPAAQLPAEAPTVMPDAVPQRPPAPARPAPSAQIRRRRRFALLGAGAGALAIAAAGIVLAGGGDPSDDTRTKPGTFVLKNDDLALSVPTSWQKGGAPEIPGLRAPDSLAAASPSGAFVAAELLSGRADPTLLPPELLKVLRGRRREPETVTADGLQTYRYGGLRARRVRGPLQAYAALTTGGVATVVCRSSSTAECDEIAGTLQLISARGVQIGLSEDYAAILKKTFATLNSQVDAVNIGIADAGTVAARAAAMRQATRLYMNASGSLGKASARLNPVDSGLNARLVAVLKSFASDYARLGRAVRRNNAAALARARRAVNRTQARLDATTAALVRLGYTSALPATPNTPLRPLRSNRPNRPIAPPPPPAGVQPPVAPPAAPPPVAPPPPPPPPPPGGDGGLDDG